MYNPFQLEHRVLFSDGQSLVKQSSKTFRRHVFCPVGFDQILKIDPAWNLPSHAIFLKSSAAQGFLFEIRGKCQVKRILRHDSPPLQLEMF